MKGIGYYRHDSDASDSPKLEYLRTEYGWAGEGQYWALLGYIARAEDCNLDLGKKFIKGSIANKLGFRLSELDDFITFLHKECELLLRDGNLITTQGIQETFAKVQKGNHRNF